MEIMFENARQVEIADLLWVADSQKEVDAVIRKFGREAVVVQQMIIAAAFDEITDVSDAEQVLEKFR
jgi:hypothetical protein